MVCNKKTNNFSITIGRKIIAKISIIPAIAFLIVAIFVGLSQAIDPIKNTHAAPGGPTTISASYDASSVDFHFTSTDLANSAFKQGAVTASVSTNNPTGFTFYISSTDEDTDLEHTSPSSMAKIPSIGTSLVESNFTVGSWGYSSDATNFNPIPKASAPSAILVTNNNTSQRIAVNFGVKASPSLESGSYTKQLLLTATTNYTPSEATFLPGSQFRTTINDLERSGRMREFKRATTLPANLTSARVVSSSDSYRVIYAWYDSGIIYWWSDADTVYMNEDASNMFYGLLYRNMDLLDLTGINMSKVKRMPYFFTSNKINHFLSDNFNTSNVEDMSFMFYNTATSNGDYSEILNAPGFSTKNVKNMSNMFRFSQVTSLNLSGLDFSNVEDMSHMLQTGLLTSLNLTGLHIPKVKDMSYFVSGTKLSDYNVLSALDTSNVENMSGMFSVINNVSHFIFPNINMSSVNNMSEMFAGSKFSSMDLTAINTSNIIDMSRAFSCMSELTNLDLSNFRTQNVRNMSEMFSRKINSTELSICDVTINDKLQNLNLSNWDTRNVENMSKMFYEASKLTQLDLSNFNTSNVTNMSNMFNGTRGLTSLNISSFDTRRVVDMSGMFRMSMVDNLDGTLDVSSFDTRSVINMASMFYGMKVKTIYASNLFITNQVNNSAYMFAGCFRIRGGNGTTFVNSNPKDKTYARIDAPGAPGYFTLKP